jgi:hypothetical protein
MFCKEKRYRRKGGKAAVSSSEGHYPYALPPAIHSRRTNSINESGATVKVQARRQAGVG